MATRSIAQVAPTATSIAMNAYIYAFAEHSLVTPHATLKQMWWTDERIEAKVTRSFIVQKLRGQEREFLNRPLAFGEGLTDDTYMDWLLEKAKRLFIIMADVGVPEQIFGCIDDSWGDDDLPLSKEDVISLELSYERDDVLNQRFYDRQFTFLLRELAQGMHINYGPNEHIPMDPVDSVAVAVTIQGWDRVRFPNKPEIYMRRKFALSDQETGQDYRQSFMRDVKRATELCHRHIAPVWASYTSENAGYVLFDLVGAHTLQSFIDHRTPPQWLRVPTAQRPFVLCEWMHCLSDALAFLHHCGIAHTTIRPSNIIIDDNNRIAFADIGCLRTFQRGKKVNRTEVYDYSAPETVAAQDHSALSSSHRRTGSLRTLQGGSGSDNSGNALSGDSNSRVDSVCSNSPDIEKKLRTQTSASSLRSPVTSSSSSVMSSSPFFRNFSRHLTGSSPSLRASRPLFSPAPTQNGPERPDVPSTQRDIFALGCIYLDMFTFLLRGKNTDFVKHRTKYPSSNIKRDGTAKKRSKNDTSFHSRPDMLDEWILTLESDARKILSSASAPTSPVYRATPSFLGLIRRMLAPTPAGRPTALEVRNRLTEILTLHCNFPARNLCCGESEWEYEEEEPTDVATPEYLHQHPQRQRQRQSQRQRQGREDDGAPVMDLSFPPFEKDGNWFDELNAIAAAKGLSGRPQSGYLTAPSSLSSARAGKQRAKSRDRSPARRHQSAVAAGSSVNLKSHPDGRHEWRPVPLPTQKSNHALFPRAKRFGMVAVDEEEDDVSERDIAHYHTAPLPPLPAPYGPRKDSHHDNVLNGPVTSGSLIKVSTKPTAMVADRVKSPDLPSSSSSAGDSSSRRSVSGWKKLFSRH